MNCNHFTAYLLTTALPGKVALAKSTSTILSSVESDSNSPALPLQSTVRTRDFHKNFSRVIMKLQQSVHHGKPNRSDISSYSAATPVHGISDGFIKFFRRIWYIYGKVFRLFTVSAC